jgi:ACS family tartrate transporter-like MFS transporter
MLFVRTPVQFYAMRFLLGAAEAGFFPGILYYLTQWFPANIRARTISRFYISLPLSAVLMGGVGGALLSLEGRFHLHGWQWLFLVEGMPAVLLSFAFFKLLPDSPAEAPWLEGRERAWIGRQLAAEELSGGTHATGVGGALRDPRVWLFGLTNFLMLGVSYGTTFFLPAIFQNLTHLDITRIGYLISGLGLLGAVGMLGNAWLSERSGKSYRHIIVPALAESACLLLIALTLNPYIAVPAIALMFFFHNAIQAPLLATPTTFLTGKGAAAGLAAINMVGILGGWVFPYFVGVLRDRTGDYQAGIGVLALTMLASAGVVYWLRGMNGKRLRETAAHVSV